MADSFLRGIYYGHHEQASAEVQQADIVGVPSNDNHVFTIIFMDYGPAGYWQMSYGVLSQILQQVVDKETEGHICWSRRTARRGLYNRGH